MSRHDGVSCDACLKGNFTGRRYKCLICFDYDLCSSCYENGATTSQHTTNHPMQCILTRHDFDIFHGGEALTADQPQSLTCPFCGKMGFTEITLQEHVTANHLDTTLEVVCPICASVPGGDPNHVTDDFAAHLTLDHPSGAPREIDITDSGNRHGVRRMQQGRGLNRGVTRQSMRSVSSGFFSSSSRGDSMDPIAELLSQLSGVRRATATRQQQLERLPARRSGTSTSAMAGGANNALPTHNANVPNGNAAGGGGLSTSISNSGTPAGATQAGFVVSLGSNASNAAAAAAAAHHHPPPSLVHSSNKQQSGQTQFLLGRLSVEMESEQQQRRPAEARDRAAFVHELLLSTLSELSLGGAHSSVAADDSPSPTPAAAATCDAATQTPPSVPSTPTNPPLPSGPPPPPTKPQVKGPPPPKTQSKMVSRYSPMQHALVLQPSNGANQGRVTAAVTPPLGAAPGRGVGTGGAVSPGSGRRKPDARSGQPPPPH